MKTTRILFTGLLLAMLLLTACTVEPPMATDIEPDPTNTVMADMEDADSMDDDMSDDDMDDDDMSMDDSDDDMSDDEMNDDISDDHMDDDMNDDMDDDMDDDMSDDDMDYDDMSMDDSDDDMSDDDMSNDMVGGIDGIIEDGEYAMFEDFDGIRLWWRHDGEYLYVAMEGDTEGWVSVGIEPENGMQGADYLFGYVENGELLIWDAYGTAPRGPNHPPDTDLGGQDNIINAAGGEENGVTRFEVQIPLNSGDEYDKALESGMTYSIIVAMGRGDDYNGMHSKYAGGEMQLP